MNIKAVLRGTLEQLKLLHQALDHPATMHMVRMISVNLEEAYKQIEIEEEQENE
jgi:hypothetical protein